MLRYNVSLSHRVQQARKEAGLTQREVAEVIGVDANTISSYERGTVKPREHGLKLMALLYGKNVEWLRGADVEETPKETMVLVTRKELTHLRQYRVLQEDAQKAVDDIMSKMIRPPRGQ